MNINNLTIKAQEAVQKAQQIAMEHGHQAIEPAHLMLGVMKVDDHLTPFLFKNLG